MDLEAAEKELAVRLYRWGQMDGERERREGYPLLSPMRDETVQKCLAYVKSLSPDEYTQFVTARQKFNQPLAISLLGQALSANDKVWNDRYRMAMSQIRLEEFSWEGATKIFAVKRSLVAKILLPLLTAAFGFKPKKFDSLQWDYLEQFGDWRFLTELDLGGTWGTEIRYRFHLKRTDDIRVGLVRYKVGDSVIPFVHFVSLQSLYGLGGEPKYSIGSEEQVPLAAQSLIDVRAHLVRFIPEWLDGLSIE